MRFAKVALTLVSMAALAGAETDPEEVLTKVRELLSRGDSYAAAEYVQALGTPPGIATAYDRVVRDLAFRTKDARAVVSIGRAGILYCLTKAQEIASRTPGGDAPWRGQAKTIAYNVASGTWPGWGDITGLDSATLAAGRDAAALNLRLATELERPAKVLSAAHWLVGAHRLAHGDFEPAIRSFETSGALAKEAGEDDGALMAAGYVALARTLAGEADAGLEAALASLRERESKDARFYADQIETALARTPEVVGSGGLSFPSLGERPFEKETR